MQVLADVLNRDIRVVKSEQTCALGAAMFAAVVGGIYRTVEDAIEKMESGIEQEYSPDAARAGQYARLYQKYTWLGAFIEQETAHER